MSEYRSQSILEEEAVISNPFLGFIGAILGALAGAVLWVVLYQIGIIASIAGIAIVTLACKGYTLLARQMDVKGALISIVTAILILLAAHIFCWGFSIYDAFKADYEITLIGGILAIPEVVFHGDMLIDFLKELLIGLILIGVGGIPYLKRALHYRAAKINKGIGL